MAYIAFDLDNTLGFFELTNPLAYLWSPEYLRNPEQSAPNHPLKLSRRLQTKLREARQRFVELLAAKPELLSVVLRPNLSAMMDPIVKAWRAGKVKAVVIYSNTGVTDSVHLGKALIEHVWDAPGLFRGVADHWAPIRTADRPRGYTHAQGYVEPKKTILTLQRIFHKAIGNHVPNANTNSSMRRTLRAISLPRMPTIPLKKILFVDDRRPKHALAAQEEGGLTYLVPTYYYPSSAAASMLVRQHIFSLAIESLDQARLLQDKEYMESGFCTRDIPYDNGKLQPVRGCADLLTWVWSEMQAVKLDRGAAWKDDTEDLAETVEKFLEEAAAVRKGNQSQRPSK